MELVHHHLVDARVCALAQRDVGHDLGGGGDDGGLTVHGGIPSHHAHVLRPEDLAQGEELLAHQRLDRGGVEGTLTPCHGDEVRGVGHHGLAGAGRGGQDNVVTGQKRQGRLLLRLSLIHI